MANLPAYEAAKKLSDAFEEMSEQIIKLGLGSDESRLALQTMITCNHIHAKLNEIASFSTDMDKTNPDCFEMRKNVCEYFSLVESGAQSFLDTLVARYGKERGGN